MGSDSQGTPARSIFTARPRFGRFRNLGRHLAGDLDRVWPLDVINGVAVTAGLLTDSVVIWFHIVFLVQAVAALLLPFRRFALRCAFWTAVSVVFLALSVVHGRTPSVELSELPLLTAVLILVYLGAQARGQVVEQLTITQQLGVERSEHELESLRHQVEQAQRLELLGRASMSSAHDLRNVFSVINGCAAELIEEMHGRRAVTRVLEIVNATDRALAIVSDLQETGTQRPMSDGPIDLRTMVEHLEPLLRRLIPRTIELEISCSVEPICVRMDRTSLLQILMNLVGNATDAIDGPGTVTVKCERIVCHRPSVSATRTLAVLSVSDTGSGIPEEVLARVFEAGYTTKMGDHSGLGLATVWRIVQRWQGSIEIESSPGSGTMFRIELPLFDQLERQQALVVVAEANVRQLLIDELRELDFDVAHACEALEACDIMMERRPPDLVVLDEASAVDPSLLSVAHLGDVPVVHVLGRGAHREGRIPTNRADAMWLVNSLVTARPAPLPPLGADVPLPTA